MRAVAAAVLLVALLWLGLSALSPAGGDPVHRCVDAEGVVTFTDLPCPPPPDDGCDAPAEPETEPVPAAETAAVDDAERKRRSEASW